MLRIYIEKEIYSNQLAHTVVGAISPEFAEQASRLEIQAEINDAVLCLKEI